MLVPVVVLVPVIDKLPVVNKLPVVVQYKLASCENTPVVLPINN